MDREAGVMKHREEVPGGMTQLEARSALGTLAR
jgi:hypothetical protein